MRAPRSEHAALIPESWENIVRRTGALRADNPMRRFSFGQCDVHLPSSFFHALLQGSGSFVWKYLRFIFSVNQILVRLVVGPILRHVVCAAPRSQEITHNFRHDTLHPPPPPPFASAFAVLLAVFRDQSG